MEHKEEQHKQRYRDVIKKKKTQRKCTVFLELEPPLTTLFFTSKEPDFVIF